MAAFQELAALFEERDGSLVAYGIRTYARPREEERDQRGAECCTTDDAHAHMER